MKENTAKLLNRAQDAIEAADILLNQIYSTQNIIAG